MRRRDKLFEKAEVPTPKEALKKTMREATMKGLDKAITPANVKALLEGTTQEKVLAVASIAAAAVSAIPMYGQAISMAVTLFSSLYGALSGVKKVPAIKPLTAGDIANVVRSELDKFQSVKRIEYAPHRAIELCSVLRVPMSAGSRT